MSQEIEKADGLKLPVLPIKSSVLFPSIPVNQDLTYQHSINAFHAAEDSTVFLAFGERNMPGVPSEDELYRIGVIAKIDNSFTAEDGSVKVALRGLCRGQVTCYTSIGDTIYASVVPEEPFSSAFSPITAKALRRCMLKALEKLIRLLPPGNDGVLATAQGISDVGQLSDYIAFSSFANYSDKLKVLSEFDPILRSQLVCSVLENDSTVYSEEIHLHCKIQSTLEENQYENFLREKLRVIKEELGEDGDELDDYAEKIDNTAFSFDEKVNGEIKEKLKKDVNRLAKMPFGSAEASVIKGYLDTIFELPWNVSTEDSVDIKVAEKILEDDHDGLAKPKERILEFLAVKQLNPKIRNQIICLVGPPGVGKTSLGQSVARALGRKFARVSLGGVHDEAEIRGHRKTYIGSMPGRIIEAIRQAGSCNPVLLLDEIDKMSHTVQGDPASAMLEVLDAEQNHTFRDHYLEIPFDLSDCLFIATANNLSDVPSALIDRMEIIELSTYTDAEKLAIAKNHLIPKQLKRHGLTKTQFKIKDEAVLEIIDGYTRESGVRNLEREIASVCRKVAKGIASKEYASCTLTKKKVAELLGPRHTYNEKNDKEDLCGVVNGLAYTSVGGDILKIETSVMPGDGKIQLTGSLGDVMKESAHLAVSYIRANADELDVEKDFYKKYDIHIHVPEGATPKDGPSAGVTMLTSLTSALSRRAVRHDIAMTGELTLTGRVLPIGGLKEKTFAAYKAGIKTVIIPKDNVPDLAEIDKTVKESIEFLPVSKASDVLKVSLR